MKKQLTFAAAVIGISLVMSAGISAEEAGYYPVTVTDQAGREVTIEKEPETLVSGYYISTSLLMAMGLKDKLAGIEAGAKKRPIYSLSAPELMDLPNVGSAKEFDLEGCAALDADLIILPKKLKDAAATLEELGFTVLLVSPESQEQLEEMTELIGKATNREEEAELLLSDMEEIKENLSGLMEDVERPVVYLGGNSDLLSTAPDGMYQSSLVDLAGGKNAAAEIEDSYWVDCSYEQLLSWDPEYIILVSSAEYTVEDVLGDENLQECTAVKNQNVYHMPYDVESWDSPVPGGILGAVWLSGILHPDLISEETCEAEIAEFYKTYYNVDIYEQ